VISIEERARCYLHRGGLSDRCGRAIEYRPWGPFIYGDEEDNLYDNRCPSRRAPIRAPTHLSKSLIAGRSAMRRGVFDSVVGGRGGPFR